MAKKKKAAKKKAAKKSAKAKTKAKTRRAPRPKKEDAVVINAPAPAATKIGRRQAGIASLIRQLQVRLNEGQPIDERAEHDKVIEAFLAEKNLV